VEASVEEGSTWLLLLKEAVENVPANRAS